MTGMTGLRDPIDIARYVWVAALVALSLAPVAWKDRLYTAGDLHDFGHVFIFAITTVIIAVTAVTGGRAVLMAGAIWCLGATLELAQTLFYGNSFEWSDLLTNGIGTGIGLLCVQIVTNSRRQQRNEYRNERN
jgi:VanZ family protein